jgi:hypothetical protein
MMPDFSKQKSKLSFPLASQYTSAQTALTKNEMTAVSCFLLIFFITVGSWLTDDDWMPFKNQITPYTVPILVTSGWMQNWSLFAPTPRDGNYHSTAVIDYADGTSKLYEFPRTKIDQRDWLSHFGGEKKRKLFGDCMPWPSYKQFLPSIARFIGRANDDPNNPPTMVTILWHLIATPGPDPRHWVYRDQLPYHTGQYVTFIYKTAPEDRVHDFK